MESSSSSSAASPPPLQRHSSALPAVTSGTDGRTIGSRELVALLGFSTSAAALGIDAMLPAFADMRSDLGLAEGSSAIGAIITAFFAGLALGQLFYGPLADRFGRRPVLQVSMACYVVLAVVGALAPSLLVLVVIRFLWGLAAAGPRIVAMAVVRDSYEGDRVSQVMSSLMAVFILVPIVAPLLGAGIVSLATWRWLFGFCGLFAFGLLVWSFRLPETLKSEHRLELSAARVLGAGRTVLSNRTSSGYLLAVSALMGAFISYLSGFEGIIDQAYGLAAWFPLIFGFLASCMGAAMLANRRLVSRFGAPAVTRGALAADLTVAGLFAVMAAATAGRPPLWMFLVGMAALLTCHAFLLPNMTALALEPMAALAGTASSLIGSIQTAIGALLSSALMTTFDGTVAPMIYGFAAFALLSAVFASWARGGSLEPVAA